jgi:hypothetical protein
MKDGERSASEEARGWRAEEPAAGRPEVGEGAEDDRVMARRVERQELVQQRVQVLPRVHLPLHHHRHHRLPEVLVRRRRLNLHRLRDRPAPLLPPAALAPLSPPPRVLAPRRLGLLVDGVVGAEGGERRGAPRRGVVEQRRGRGGGGGGGLREGRVGRRGVRRRLGGLAAEAARAGLERGDEGAEQPRRAAAAPDVHHRWLRQLEPSRQPGHGCSLVAVSPSFLVVQRSLAHSKSRAGTGVLR